MSHQAAVRVIEDMAVEHPHPRSLVEYHNKSDRAVYRRVERVLPSHRSHEFKASHEAVSEKKPWSASGAPTSVSFFTVQICVSPTSARNGLAFQNGAPFTWNSDFPSGAARRQRQDDVPRVSLPRGLAPRSPRWGVGI